MAFTVDTAPCTTLRTPGGKPGEEESDLSVTHMTERVYRRVDTALQ